MKLENNTIVLLACLILVTGAGSYITFYDKPQELEQAEKAVQLAEMKQAEMEQLLTEYSTSKAAAEEAVTKWQARYKVVPDSLRSPDVIGYINDLSRRGFETFDMNLEGIAQEGEFSHYRVNVTGRGYFTSLYRFVWEVENNRPFYRIRDLNMDHMDLITTDEETGRERMQVMVSFSLSVDAYFGGPEGVSAPTENWVTQVDGELLDDEGRLGQGPPVPASVLADERPAINPFFPIVMDRLPPNTHGLPEFENATLLSIADGRAIIRDSEGIHHLRKGDDVYLGQIIRVDPVEGIVVARLNKGGLIDEARLFLDETESYRRIIGTERLQALEEN